MGNAIYRKTSILIPASDYQKWTGYPDSPVLTADYPNQFIAYSINYYFYATTGNLFRSGNNCISDAITVRYGYNGSWYSLETVQAGSNLASTSLIESNCNIYTDDSYSAVYFAKTTTPEQDGDETSVSTNIRVRNLRHKTSISLGPIEHDFDVVWQANRPPEGSAFVDHNTLIVGTSYYDRNTFELDEEKEYAPGSGSSSNAYYIWDSQLWSKETREVVWSFPPGTGGLTSAMSENFVVVGYWRYGENITVSWWDDEENEWISTEVAVAYGAVMVFRITNGSLSLIDTITGRDWRPLVPAGGGGGYTPDSASLIQACLFGYSVAIKGNRFVVGAPGYPYRNLYGSVIEYIINNDDTISQVSEYNAESVELFGWSVSMNNTTIAAGSPLYANGLGKVTIISENGYIIQNPGPQVTPEAGDCFGENVELCGDNYVVAYSRMGISWIEPIDQSGNTFISKGMLNPGGTYDTPIRYMFSLASGGLVDPPSGLDLLLPYGIKSMVSSDDTHFTCEATDITGNTQTNYVYLVKFPYTEDEPSVSLEVRARGVYWKNESQSYQHWASYPDSPVSTLDYPYQCVTVFPAWAGDPPIYYLSVSAGKIWKGINETSGDLYGYTYTICDYENVDNKVFVLDGTEWSELSGYLGEYLTGGPDVTSWIEANNDTYTDSSFSTIWKEQTIEEESGTFVNIRVNL